jgi:hypothetical protein
LEAPDHPGLLLSQAHCLEGLARSSAGLARSPAQALDGSPRADGLIEIKDDAAGLPERGGRVRVVVLPRAISEMSKPPFHVGT